MEGISPNDELVPVYVNEQLIYVTPPEYYAKYLGGLCLSQLNTESKA